MFPWLRKSDRFATKYSVVLLIFCLSQKRYSHQLYNRTLDMTTLGKKKKKKMIMKDMRFTECIYRSFLICPMFSFSKQKWPDPAALTMPFWINAVCIVNTGKKHSAPNESPRHNIEKTHYNVGPRHAKRVSGHMRTAKAQISQMHPHSLIRAFTVWEKNHWIL